MSKRRRRNRKRRGCGCGGCIVALLIVFVLFVGGLYGGSVFAWNKFVAPQIGGVTLNQTISLIAQLYKADEKKIVTNPYEAKDEDDFYVSLRDALFLSSSVDIKDTFSAVLADLLAGNNSNDNNENNNEAYFSSEELGTGSAILDEFLDILEFDFSKLEDYKDEYQTPQVLEVTDKQIAAFINGALGMVLETDAVKEQISMLDDFGIDITKIASIPQVVISNANPLKPEDTTLTATIKIEVRAAATAALQSQMPQLVFLTKLLPKALYATATIYPNNYNASSEVKINNFENTHMSNLYKIIDGVLAFSKGETSEEPLSIEKILQSVNQKAIEALESVQNIVPLSFVNTGSLEIKPIESLMNMLGVTNITQTQFLCMIRDICLPTFDSIKTKLGYSETTTRDDIQIALDESVDYFVSEIESKYAIEHGFIDANNAFDTLTNVSQDTSSFAEHINVQNLNFSSSTYVSYDHKVAVPYKALAKLINDKVGESIGDNIEASVINMVYNSIDNSIGIIVEINLYSALGDMDRTSTQFKLISQLVPENIYITANINLNTQDTTIQINGLTQEQTQAHLDTMIGITSALGMSLDSFDYTSLTSQLGEQLISALDQIEVQLGTQIIFEDEQALLPNIYEVMAGTILYSSEVEDNLTAAQVYGVFRDLHAIPEEYVNSNKYDDISNFIDEVNDKYYISNENKLSTTKEDSIVTQLTGLADSYDTAIMGAELANAWIDATASATTQEEKNAIILTDFSPMIEEGELTTVFAQTINITADSVKDLTLHSVYIMSDTQIEIIMKADFASSNLDTMDYSKLIPEFIIKVILDISKINSEEKCCLITLNNMDPEGTLSDFILLCSRLGSSTFNITDIEEQCDTTIKTQLASLFNKITLTLSPATMDEEARAYIGSIYDAAYNNLKTDATTFTKVDIADTISALHKEINVVGQNNIDIVSDKYSGEPTASVSGSNLEVGATLSARNIGASVLESGFSTISANLHIPEDEIELYQIALIDYTDKTILSGYMEEFSSYLTSDLDVENIAAITMRIGAQNLGYTSTLLPANLYLSIFINLDNGDIEILYNNLNEKQLDVLASLSGGNADALDVEKSATEMQSYMRGVVLFDVTYLTFTTQIKFGDVIDAHAGLVEKTTQDDKVCGNYSIDYYRSLTEIMGG